MATIRLMLNNTNSLIWLAGFLAILVGVASLGRTCDPAACAAMNQYLSTLGHPLPSTTPPEVSRASTRNVVK